MLPLKDAGAFAESQEGKEEDSDEEVLEVEEQNGDESGESDGNSGEDTVLKRHHRRGELHSHR